MLRKNMAVNFAIQVFVVLFAALFFAAAAMAADGGLLQVTVQKSPQNPIDGITVYLFDENGTYLGLNQVTNVLGIVGFRLAEGTYKVRADYLGYQFWSDNTPVTSDIGIDLNIPHQDVTVTLEGNYQAKEPLSGVPIYLFTEAGRYMGQKQTTGSNGQVVFNLPEQGYKVRADYLRQQFWSDVFAGQDTGVTVPMADAQLLVTGGGLPLPGVNVYVFSVAGTYLGFVDATDAGGAASFRLPAGSYKFRADYQSSQYWSAEATLTAGQVNPIEINTGGGEFSFTVFKGASDPLPGVKCYVFNEAGQYLGMTGVTNSNGPVTFNLSNGSFKFRVDYMEYRFWSPIYTVPDTLTTSLTVAHQDVNITVEGDYQGTEPIEGVPVYLFTPSGIYMSQSRTTDANGQVVFNLPEKPYKVRADYMGQKYWSSEFTWQETVVTVPMSEAEIQVSGSGLPLGGVRIYVFSALGAYLSQSETTDASGNVSFRLPVGAYKFRADYQGSHYWSAETTLTAGQVNPVEINTGGGEFSFTVLKGATDPLSGVKCYVFNEAGTYLGISGVTSSEGLVSFNLADGIYKFRVDYLGYQFWSPIYTVPGGLSASLSIDHQDVTISVEGDYQGTEPIEGVSVYLFTSSGRYMSQSRTTDANGQVVFNLPEQPYRVRADYMGQQFWSEIFSWQDGIVSIHRGLADIHVVRNGADVAGARVYLFSEQGRYLVWYETTGSSGDVEFLLPNRAFQFRANEGADQQWSPVIDITAGVSTNIEIDLAPVTVNITADPDAIEAGASSTLSWSSTGAQSCVIEPDIGTADVTGSISVSPTVTTDYTITATGPGGSAADSVRMMVIAALEDVDYGLDYNEHQGGGGLVGETVRILNGNQIEVRNDLNFVSPNSLGLIFQAFYNSRSNYLGDLGLGWTHTYTTALDIGVDGLTGNYIRLMDETGRAHYFLKNGPGVYEGYFKELTQIKEESGGYVWYRLDGSRFGFSAGGKLVWIDDEKGNQLSLIYNAQGLLETVTDSASAKELTFNYANGLLDHISGPVTEAVADGIWVSYGYDALSNLISVTYADGSGFNYAYTDANDVHNLTEKRNQSNHLLATWGYDTQDRCTASYRVQGSGVGIDYFSATQVEVTDAYGTQRTYTIGAISGRKRVVAMQGLAAAPYDGSSLVGWQYDAALNLTEVQTAGGTIHHYQNYDERGNPATVILAAGSPEARTITYSYHPQMNAILTRGEPGVLGAGNKDTIFDYDDDGDAFPNEGPSRQISRIIEKGYTRDAAGTVVSYEYITKFTYNAKGQLLSVDGPLAGSVDITSFAYDVLSANLLSVTHPLIGGTSFSDYDAAGQAGRLTDVTGQSRSFAYDGRGRVTAITHEGDSSEKTVHYNPAGLPDTITDEDGVAKTYNYDDNNRLSRIYDVENNYIDHLYDDQGNLVERGRYDAAATRTGLKRWYFQSHTDFADELPTIPGKLWKARIGTRSPTTYGYNTDGQLSAVTDPNGNTTYYDYDAQNRLISVTQPAGTITSYDYDSHGNLVSVIDAETLITTYTYDDMGRMVETTSADTGTVRYVYDAAGNMVQKTDARGITVIYTYDVLNRLTHVHFPDSTQDRTSTIATMKASTERAGARA